MPNPVKPVPEGYRTITPYLTVTGAAQLLDFLKAAFDAVVVERMEHPPGVVRHAEVRIGDSMIMLGEAPDPAKTKPGSLYLYMNDVDATYQRAIQAGATSIHAPSDMFYGDRSGGVEDASGNTWWIATHIEDVSPDELKRRAAAAGRG